MREPIKVVVHGALGKMGREVVSALCHDHQLKPVGAVEREISRDRLPLPDDSGFVPFSSNLELIIGQCRPDVLVDFTMAEATMPAVRTAAKHKVNLVIGTTGLSSDDLAEIDKLSVANKVGAVVAPNFALGAVVMIHLAKIAARFFDYAEIIELHHDKKLDAPSGTGLKTAEMIAEVRESKKQGHPDEKELIEGARGADYDGIRLNSVRLPGMIAHQEVLFGMDGQTLTLRHDSYNRASFMSGVKLSVEQVMKIDQLVYGLENIID